MTSTFGNMFDRINQLFRVVKQWISWVLCLVVNSIFIQLQLSFVFKGLCATSLKWLNWVQMTSTFGNMFDRIKILLRVLEQYIPWVLCLVVNSIFVQLQLSFVYKGRDMCMKSKMIKWSSKWPLHLRICLIESSYSWEW
jgi:hypothetical protein